MFVGQDWGGVANLDELKANKDADMKSATARNLRTLLEAAGIRLEECFFTNALFGIRSEGEKITGRSPGWKHKRFRQQCEEALIIQIEKIEPKAIVCLGRDAPDLLVQIVEKCRPWKTAKNFVKIDANGFALILLNPPVHRLIAAAILLHPSYRHANAKHRIFEKTTGHDAEVNILKALWKVISSNEHLK